MGSLLQTVCMRLILLLGCYSICVILYAREPAKVTVMHIPDSNTRVIREILGTVIPQRTQTLGFDIVGTVVSQRLEMGTAVQRGQILIQLDDREASARLKLAQADVDIARVALGLKTAQFARAEKNHQRGAISDAEFEQVSADLARSKSEQLKMLAQRAIAVLQLEKHSLRASFGGLLQQATPEPGTRVSPEEVAVSMVDTRMHRVKVLLSPSELKGLEEGQNWLTLDGNVLTRIACAPDAERDTGLNSVELSLPVGASQRAGEITQLTLIQQQTALQLSQLSLRSDARGEYVLIVEEGRARRVDLPTLPDDNYVPIINELLGKDIILLAPGGLQTGDPVKVITIGSVS